MALIQCLLGAASPILSSHTYVFERDKHGRFVAEVFDLVHIQCLLSREDIYRIAPEVVETPVQAHIESLLGSSVLPSMVEIGAGLQIQLGTLVARSHEESGLSIQEWNALPEAEREALLASTLDVMKAEQDPPVDPVPAPQGPAPEAEQEGNPEPKDEAGEKDADGDEQEEPAVVDAVVSGVVTEAVASPASKPRRGRRGR